jgi:amino acid adenylation domain-containing protein
MTGVAAWARSGTAADGKPVWVRSGETQPLPRVSVWARIEASLLENPARPRMKCGGQAYCGTQILADMAALAVMPHGCRVGVHIGRSAAMVTAVLATWSRGSIYMPLPTDLPATRLSAMIEHCRPDIIISDAENFQAEFYRVVERRTVAGRMLKILAADAGWLQSSEASSKKPGCYITHTSGSTGTPKAILVSDAALMNRLCALQSMVARTHTDCVLFKTSMAFDVHIWEFAFPLIAGAMLVIYEQERFFDLRNVARLIADEGVTICGFVPSLLSALLDRPDVTALHRLRLMFCGGEQWNTALARKHYEKLPGCLLRNSYGPAETTLAVANWPVPNWLISGEPAPDRIEIGPPLQNTIFTVTEIDRAGDMVTGLLGVGGAQVAEGYLGAANDRFYESASFSPPCRFYDTGDVVSLNIHTGALVFQGRQDQQVKLHGVRIELGEIEAAIMSLEGVETCAVVLIESPEKPCLVATFKTSGDMFLDPASVRRRCAELLPATHVPAYFRKVDFYQLNASGKLDRAGLSRLMATAPSRSPGPP